MTDGLAAIRAAAGGDQPNDAVSKADHDAAAIAAAAQTASADGAKRGGADERARIQLIVSSPEAKGRETLAQSLAFDTDLTPEQAIKALKASPVEMKSRLDGNVPNPRVEVTEGDKPGTPNPNAMSAFLKKKGMQPRIN
jgi:hypothetical protein